LTAQEAGPERVLGLMRDYWESVAEFEVGVLVGHAEAACFA